MMDTVKKYGLQHQDKVSRKMTAGQDDKSAIDLSDRLRELMTSNDLTVSDMAVRAGVSKSALEKYLAGPSSPRVASVVAICNSFGVSADWLLFGVMNADPLIIHQKVAHVISQLLNDLKQGGPAVSGFHQLDGSSREWRMFALETADLRAREATAAIERARQNMRGLEISYGPFMPFEGSALTDQGGS